MLVDGSEIPLSDSDGGMAWSGSSVPPPWRRAPPSRCTRRLRRRRGARPPASPPVMTRHGHPVTCRPRDPSRLPSRDGLDPKRSRTIWRSPQQPDVCAPEHCGTPLSDHRSTSIGSRRRGRCRRRRSTPGSPASSRDPGGREAAPHRRPLARPPSSAGESPGKGASPRSTRSALMASKSCSGTLSWAKLAGSAMGPTPSFCRAVSMASRVTPKQELVVSPPSGAHTSV